jgi:hypothetical protein
MEALVHPARTSSGEDFVGRKACTGRNRHRFPAALRMGEVYRNQNILRRNHERLRTRPYKEQVTDKRVL